MQQTLHRVPAAAFDAAVDAVGDLDYTARASAIRGRYEPSYNEVVRVDGVEQAVVGTVSTYARLSFGDRVYPPGADLADIMCSHGVIAVRESKDLFGTHVLYEAKLGR